MIVIVAWVDGNSGVECVGVTVEFEAVVVDVAVVGLVCVCKFNVTVPGPLKLIVVGLLAPEQARPPMQFQLEIV